MPHFKRMTSFDTHCVCSLVPKGFPRYARIFHPAWRVDPVRRLALRWADLAKHAGKTPHALMQWSNIAVPTMHGDMVEHPDEGRMPEEVIGPLRKILSCHTKQGAGCWLGAAREWGWDYRKSTPATARIDRGARAWDLFRAPVSMMNTRLFTNQRQTANLIWCEDVSWWVTTDIDLVTTYIGGSETLIHDILGSPALEAWPAAPDDDITYEADTVNSAGNCDN